MMNYMYPAALILLLAKLSTTPDTIKNYISMFWF